MTLHAAPPEKQPSASRLTAFALAHPVWVIAALVLAQQVPLIWVRGLWWSDEVRHGGVLADLTTQGHFWALTLNGQPYDDKPPVYFWYLAGIQALVGPGAVAFFTGLAGTVLAYALATWHLARRLGLDRPRALGAVGVLLSGSYMLAASHYARMDFLFSAAILLAWGSFYLASAKPQLSARAVLAGFAFATLAAWIKGPVGVALPVLGFALHLAVMGRGRDLLARPVLGGVVLLLAGIALWAGGLVWFGGEERLASLFAQQIVGRAMDSRGQGWAYLRYLVTFPAVLLPFALLAFWPPNWRALATSANRYLLICLGAGWLLLTLIGEKHEYYLIPLMPLASILLVQMLGKGLTPFLALWLAGQTVLALVAQYLGGWIDPKALHILPALAAAAPAGAVGLALALALWLWGRSRSWGQVLAGFVAAQTLFAAILLGRVMPALDPVLSPAALAALMRPAVAAGYAPAVAHGIPGVFAFDLGQPYAALTTDQAVLDWLATKPRGVLALQQAEWQAIAAHAPQAQTLGCLPFLGQDLIVLAFPPGLDASAIAQDTGCPDP